MDVVFTRMDVVFTRMDVVFTRTRVAVQVDGCFWHGCPVHGTSARSNATYWFQKIEANRRRDQDTRPAAAGRGLGRGQVWEHDVRHRCPPQRTGSKPLSSLDASSRMA